VTHVPVYALSGSSDSPELSAARPRAFSDSPEHPCFFYQVAPEISLHRRRVCGIRRHLFDRPQWVSRRNYSPSGATVVSRPEADHRPRVPVSRRYSGMMRPCIRLHLISSKQMSPFTRINCLATSQSVNTTIPSCVRISSRSKIDPNASPYRSFS